MKSQAELNLSKFIPIFIPEMKGGEMETVLSSKTTSISEFKNNPAAALAAAGEQPFAVLTNNKPSFYVVQPELYEALTELLFDLEMTPIVKKRLARLKKAIPVNLEDL